MKAMSVIPSPVSASMVLENSVIFGTVSAARRHHERTVEALAAADPAWLGGVISRRGRCRCGRRCSPGSQMM